MKKYFTVSDLRNSYVSNRDIWVPLAEKAVDKAMRNCILCGNHIDKKCCRGMLSVYRVYNTVPDKVSMTNKAKGKKTIVRCGTCNAERDLTKDDLDTVLAWFNDHDAGYSTFERAIKAMAKDKGKVKEFLDEEWFNKAKFFVNAWVKAQNRYSKLKYGIALF